MNANMNTIRTMLVAAAVALAASAHAQNCSGGPEGGMDATGNQCSQSNPAAATAATPGMNPAPGTTATSRNIAAASPIIHPQRADGREHSVAAASPAARPAKGTEPASVAPHAVKVSSARGVN